MGCIKTIGASIAQQTLADADAPDEAKAKEREAETDADADAEGDAKAETETGKGTREHTNGDAEADARIMATGICIIRLITLKRFLENSKTEEHNQRRQQSATSAASAEPAGATSPRRRHLHYPGHSAVQPGHPEACALLVLLLLTSLWPDCCECLHGGSNTVKTKYGLLRGIVVRSSPLVEAFLGIPYASPPVGSLR